MKTIFNNEIWLINIVSILLILIISFLPITALRIILGLPFLLFFPGYVWISALFPRKKQLDVQERILFSFGLSIVMVPLVGLISNAMPWGIKLYPLLITLSLVILAGSLVSWLRCRNLNAEARAGISLHLNLLWWTKAGVMNKTLTILLVATVLGMVGVISYFIANPKVSETYTQFYILGSQGTTESYPDNVPLGKPAQVILGVVDLEKATISYQIEIKIDGTVNTKLGPFVLKHGEKWEKPIAFTPTKVGDNQKVEFYLYRDGELDPNRKPLRLLVDVIK